MDVKEFRKKCQDEVTEARAAGTGYGSPKDLPSRREADANTRAEAMTRMTLHPGNLDERIPYFLDVLSKKSETVTQRSAALDMLSAAEFLGPAFDDYRPQVIETVRALASDKSPALRTKALEYLAQQSDDHARDILTEAVQSPEKSPVGQAKAIQLLGLDDHANAADLIRDRFEELSETAQEEAMHILGTDPKSADKLSSVLADKGVRQRLRRITAAGLKALDQERFTERARDVLEDSGESAQLKTALVSMVQTARAGYDETRKSALDSAVETAGKRTRSKTLKSAAARYFAAQRAKS